MICISVLSGPGVLPKPAPMRRQRSEEAQEGDATNRRPSGSRGSQDGGQGWGSYKQGTQDVTSQRPAGSRGVQHTPLGLEVISVIYIK